MQTLSEHDTEAIRVTQQGASALPGKYQCPHPFSQYFFVIDHSGRFTFHNRSGRSLFVTEFKKLFLDDGGTTNTSVLKLMLQSIYPRLVLFQGSQTNPDLTVHHMNKDGNDHRVSNLQFKTRSDNSREGCREELRRKNSFRVALSHGCSTADDCEWQQVMDTDPFLADWKPMIFHVLRGELPFATHSTLNPDMNLFVRPDDVRIRCITVQTFLATQNPRMYSIAGNPELSLFVAPSGLVVRPNEGLIQYGCPMGRHTFELHSEIFNMDCGRVVWDLFGHTPRTNELHVGHSFVNGLVLLRCDEMRTVDKNVNHQVVNMTYREFLQCDPKPNIRAVFNNSIDSLFLATQREILLKNKRGQAAFELLQMLNSDVPRTQGISDAYAIHMWQVCNSGANSWGIKKWMENLCGHPSKRKRIGV